MWSFLTGVVCSIVLAGGTYLAMQAGTITMVEMSDDVSTRLEGVWHQQSPATMSVPLATEGNLGE